MTIAVENNSDVFISMRRQKEEFQPGLSPKASLAERIMYDANPLDIEFRNSIMGNMPDSLAIYFATRYSKIFKTAKKDNRRLANTFLRKVAKNVLPRYNLVLSQYQFNGVTLGYDFFPEKYVEQISNLHTLDRGTIKELANGIARYLTSTFTEFCQRADYENELEGAKSGYTRIGQITLQIGTVPPYWKQFTKGRGITEGKMLSGLLRMMSDKWWYGRLKRMRDLRAEHLAIAVGQVQKSASPYVSRKALHEWIEQKKRNWDYIKSFDLTNEHGDRVSLEEMVLASVSNPAVRRCELMVRMRGFENMANEMGYVGEFYTLTAPSKYHNAYSKGGFIEQWNGASPRDVQKYLCKVWSKVRAEYAREGIRPFGFRVVEPHHDSTPHWHLLLFVHPDHVEKLREIFAEYAREEDAFELKTKEAKEARFYVEPIDKEKGSATGYIAKYISKNIDGYAMDDEIDDETGQKCKDMAKAVSAWASLHRIRQFQQIGGAPVSVWRELRRLPGDEQILATEDMDNVRFASDVGDWYAYTELQGGATVKRRDLTVRLSYEVTEMGNEYGEDVKKIKGVYSPLACEDSFYLTRTAKWELVAKESTSVKGSGLAFDGAISAPWSSVNNCTGDARTINDEEKVVTEILDNFRSIGHEITLEDAQKMRNGSGIIIDDKAFRSFDDGSLIRMGTTQLKYRQFHERKDRIFNKVNKLREISHEENRNHSRIA
ncbi:replication endonuclease [Proteus mirabilis]|uniref:replication endonuclease n=1 Tax=Proteus mirabilis TaxID=584 RepID=UPI0039195D63